MNRRFIYRSPDNDGGGGPGFSLNDLGGGTDPGFESNDPVLTPEEIAAKAAKQDGIDTPPKADDITDPAVDPNAKPDDVGDAAGKLPETDAEKEAREAQEAADAEAAAAAEAEGNDDEDPKGEKFLAAVNALRGDDFDKTVEYPDGVIPTTPEGIHFRDKALEKHAVDKWESYLKQSDPRGYAYLLHRQNGGTDEEFLSKGSAVLPDLDAMKESVDLQREVYRQGLIANGLPEKQVKALVEMAAKDGELLAEAEAMHAKIKADEEKQLEDANKKLETKTKADQKAITDFSGVLEKEILQGANLKFVIPDAEKPKFMEYLKNNIRYDDGQFYLVKPVTKDNLVEQIQTELFGHLKGDLKKLVERNAKTLVAQRLKLTNDKPKPKAGEAPQTTGLSLGQI